MGLVTICSHTHTPNRLVELYLEPLANAGQHSIPRHSGARDTRDLRTKRQALPQATLYSSESAFLDFFFFFFFFFSASSPPSADLRAAFFAFFAALIASASSGAAAAS